MTATWSGAAPEILLLVAVLGIPGLLVARCLRFRWWDAVGLSVPLSLGVLAIADEVAMHAHTRWGLPVIAATTVLVALVCWAIARWLLGTSVDSDAESPLDGARWDRRGHVIAGLVTIAAAVVGAIAVARGIGTPHSIIQTWDGAFHVNSINAVAQHHSAAPTVVNQAGGSTSTGFYPPLFAAVAALATMHGGVNAIVAANLTAVVIAFMWPITMSIVVRRIARTGVFGYAVAMVGAVTITLFPALLLEYGTLWPNALSILCIGPALVLMLRILGLDRGGDGSADPHGTLIWRASLAALILVLPGIAFSQPASAFALFYLGMPMVIWVLWRRFIAPDADRARRVLVGSGVVIGAGLVSIGLIAASYLSASIRTTGNFPWKTRGSVLQGVRRVLELHSLLAEANLAFALLVVVGICVGLTYARGRFLVIGYVILATLYVFAFAIQSHLTMRLTGYWYNDAFRLIGMLPLMLLPLAAIGADALFRLLRTGLARVMGGEETPTPTRTTTIAVASMLVVCIAIAALQGGLGTSKVSKTVSGAYANSRLKIVTPPEAAMFERLRHEVPQGQAIAGDPFNGEVFVGILSGHPSIYTSFSLPKGDDRVLVGKQFANYLHDPAVCAAVKRLNIGAVVAGPKFAREGGRLFAWAGFQNLAAMAQTPHGGLKVIDSGGGATAYLLTFQGGSCTR